MALKKELKIEEPPRSLFAENNKMEFFSKKVIAGHGLIKEIEVRIEKLRELRNDFDKYTGEEKEKLYSESIRKLSDEVVSNQTDVKTIMDSLQTDLEEAKKDDKVS